MATSSTRALWKGAISFGLVHIPVALHSATAESGIDFDWLDKRTMDPVGYKRINKKTGKEIDKANIIKGVAYEEGEYVVLTDEEIAAAYPKTTQTIEIEAFVSASEIPFVYLERPYYLSPIGKGEKVYALLRETLLRSQRIGIAKVVIQTKQHLAALVPSGPALVLNLLRWGEEIRTWDELQLPPEGTQAARLNERELAMAQQLVDDMTAPWDPAQYTNSFADEVRKLVDRKVAAGQLETVTQPEAEPGQSTSADIIDLTELLQRSLKRKGAAGAGDAGEGGAAPAAKSDSKRSAKTARKAAAKGASKPAAKSPARRRAA